LRLAISRLSRATSTASSSSLFVCVLCAMAVLRLDGFQKRQERTFGSGWRHCWPASLGAGSRRIAAVAKELKGGHLAGASIAAS
jgi:hypothetical protein